MPKFVCDGICNLLPHSSIIFNKNKTILNKFNILIEKYILESSPRQINISYSTASDVKELQNKIKVFFVTFI